MATTLELEHLYLAYFGRPPDASGAAFYANQTVAQVEAAFEASPESKQLYASSAGQVDPTMVATAYQHLFNRAPSAAEAQAWVDLAGRTGMSPAATAAALVAAAQNTDATALVNRTAYVQQWVATFNTQAVNVKVDAAAAAALAIRQLATIGTDPAAVTAANSATNIALSPAPAPAPAGPAPAPVTNLVLTTGATDVVLGTTGDDVINAITGTGATLNTGDTIDGSGGTDTLAIANSTATSLTLSNTPVTNVEKLQVQSTGAAFALDATGVAGLTDVINNGSTQDVTFQGLANVVNVAVQNVNNKATTVSFSGTALAGGTDALTLTLQNATGGAAVTLKAAAAAANELETLNIVSTGTANNIKLGTDTTQTSLATINISGAAPLALNFSGATDHVLTSATTIDAHLATGGVTIGSYATGAALGLGAANHNITLGTGANVVFFGFVDNGGGSYTSFLDANDTVNATAGGNDTLVITGAGVTSANLVNVTGVETMRFMNSTGTLTQDVTQLPGSVTQLQVDGADSIVAFNHLANNITLDVLQGWQLKTALATNTGADALTVRLTPATTAGTTLATLFDTTGVTLETLNLVSNGFTGQTAANVITTDQNTSAHVLTGSADLTITSAIVASSFDASAFTGKLKIIGQVATATTIKGGSGGDTITLGTGADTVDAGGGNDTIYTAALGTTSHAARGADSIVTGAGNDTIVFADNVSAGNGGANYASLPGITDFHTGATTADTDLLAFSSTNASFQLTPTGGAASTGLAKGATAQGLTLGDAMVVQTLSATDSAAVATANVSFFKLGTTTAFSTDNATTFANAMGTASVTGLAANGNYIVSLYDTGVGRAVIGVVNVGGSANNDTTLSSADFVSADVAVIGTVTMTSGEYATFSATQLAAAF
jgi:hypothetical protein